MLLCQKYIWHGIMIIFKFQINDILEVEKNLNFLTKHLKGGFYKLFVKIVTFTGVYFLKLAWPIPNSLYFVSEWIWLNLFKDLKWCICST